MRGLDSVLASLSKPQREAADWNGGAALLLAGPGAGKTRVLTARIARLLDESPKKNFRILALTFTTKAANEMKERVEAIVPGSGDRTFIGTFHAFCAQLLQQHGSLIGIKSDFGIYDQEADRRAMLADALREAQARGENVSAADIRWLRSIDVLRADLIIPERTAARYTSKQRGAHVAAVYKIYENGLRSRNVLDFHGLVLEASRLAFKFPAVANRVRSTYPFWLVDEFQDTSPAQYRLLGFLAGTQFKNVFAVADDDQIIYQWAGASYRQIVKFRDDFGPTVMQLVENHRCPPGIVECANKLVAFNKQRTPNKMPLIAARTDCVGPLTLRRFRSDEAERQTLVADIVARGAKDWGRTAILARNRFLLQPTLEELRSAGVKGVLSQRRDRFLSAPLNWLQGCIEQAVRPADKQMFVNMADAGAKFLGVEVDVELIAAEALAEGRGYMEQWGLSIERSESPIAQRAARIALSLVRSRVNWRRPIRDALGLIKEQLNAGGRLPDDVQEDIAAWDACMKEIRAEKGDEPDLDEIVRGLALRSKEPPLDPDAVTLMTIHGAKGLEFDIVYVIGLGEGVMPSWQSINEGGDSAEMEEERRNCFVAITRTRQELHLSFADSYRGRVGKASRFLEEMGLRAEESSDG